MTGGITLSGGDIPALTCFGNRRTKSIHTRITIRTGFLQRKNDIAIVSSPREQGYRHSFHSLSNRRISSRVRRKLIPIIETEVIPRMEPRLRAQS